MPSKPSDPLVASVFASYPSDVRKPLLALRQLILKVASKTPGVGPIQETLKWGQPSYLTPATKSGSTLRIDRLKNSETEYALFFNCRTDLVLNIKEEYGPLFEYEGNRALHFKTAEPLPKEAVEDCIARALTYHLRKVR